MNKSNCKKCIHTEVCKIKDIFEKLNTDALTKKADELKVVEIDIKCKFFKEIEDEIKSITGDGKSGTITIPTKPDPQITLPKIDSNWDCPCINCSSKLTDASCCCVTYLNWLRHKNHTVILTSSINPCEGCEWLGKPYHSVVSPCEGCTRNPNKIVTSPKVTFATSTKTIE